jgi:hypothetical protein
VTPEIAKLLREPFPAEVVGKLPRVWCKQCRDVAKSGRTCNEHQKARCRDCRNNITTAHLHLDYVGHAETTDRFLAADPEWTWEPLAYTADGLPAFDRHGGLWIRLTIAGVTRLGYGAAEGKDGPDAVKEVIGDALRNGGMRFGVALDLWGAKFKDGTDEQHDEPPRMNEHNRQAFLTNARGAIAHAADTATFNEIDVRVTRAAAAGVITDDDVKDLRHTIADRLGQIEVATVPGPQGEQAQMDLR